MIYKITNNLVHIPQPVSHPCTSHTQNHHYWYQLPHSRINSHVPVFIFLSATYQIMEQSYSGSSHLTLINNNNNFFTICCCTYQMYDQCYESENFPNTIMLLSGPFWRIFNIFIDLKFLV